MGGELISTQDFWRTFDSVNPANQFQKWGGMLMQWRFWGSQLKDKLGGYGKKLKPKELYKLAKETFKGNQKIKPILAKSLKHNELGALAIKEKIWLTAKAQDPDFAAIAAQLEKNPPGHLTDAQMLRRNEYEQHGYRFMTHDDKARLEHLKLHDPDITKEQKAAIARLDLVDLRDAKNMGEMLEKVRILDKRAHDLHAFEESINQIDQEVGPLADPKHGLENCKKSAMADPSIRTRLEAKAEEMERLGKELDKDYGLNEEEIAAMNPDSRVYTQNSPNSDLRNIEQLTATDPDGTAAFLLTDSDVNNNGINTGGGTPLALSAEDAITSNTIPDSVRRKIHVRNDKEGFNIGEVDYPSKDVFKATLIEKGVLDVEKLGKNYETMKNSPNHKNLKALKDRFQDASLAPNKRPSATELMKVAKMVNWEEEIFAEALGRIKLPNGASLDKATISRFASSVEKVDITKRNNGLDETHAQRA